MVIKKTHLAILFLSYLLAVGTVHAALLLKVASSVEADGTVSSIDVSSRGYYVAVGTTEGKVSLLGESLKPLWTSSLSDSILSVAVSKDGRYVAAGDGSSVYLFDEQGNFLWGERGRIVGDDVRDVDVSANGDYVVTGSSNYLIRLFDKNGELWSKDLGATVQGVGISHTGEYIAAGTSKGMVYLFDRNGAVIWEKNVNEFLIDVAVFDQDVVAVGRSLHFISGGELKWSYFLEPGEASSVDFSQEGGLIATGSLDRAYVFNKEGKRAFVYSSPDEIVDVGIFNNGRIVVGAGGEVRFLEQSDTSAPEESMAAPEETTEAPGIVSAAKEIVDDKETEIVSAAKEIVTETKEKLSEASGVASGGDSQTPSVQVPRSVEIPKWAVGLIIVVPTVVYLYRRLNGNKRYRWKPKKRGALFR